MGVGNWMADTDNIKGEEWRCHYFYIDIPDCTVHNEEGDIDYDDSEWRSESWSEELEYYLESLLEDDFHIREGWNGEGRNSVRTIAEDDGVEVILHNWGGYFVFGLVCDTDFTEYSYELEEDTVDEEAMAAVQLRMENLYNNISKELHKTGYNLRVRTSSWTSAGWNPSL